MATAQRTPGDNVTAAEIRVALRERYPDKSHALLFEVANGTGAQARRYADAVAMGLWPSHGLEIDGFEIKVSKADWTRELKDPSKSDAIARYCHRWWVVAPKGVVPPGELPTPWGLLELQDDGKLRQRVAAPRQEPVDVDRAFVASMLRRAAESHHADVDTEVARQVEQARQKIKEQTERHYQNRLSFRMRAAEEAMEKVKAIEAATGIDLTRYTPTDEIVRAIQFGLGIVNRVGAIWDLKRGAEQVLKSIDDLKPQDFDYDEEPAADSAAILQRFSGKAST